MHSGIMTFTEFLLAYFLVLGEIPLFQFSFDNTDYGRMGFRIPIAVHNSTGIPLLLKSIYSLL